MALLMALSAVAVGCGGTDPPPPLQITQFSTASPTVQAGGSAALTALFSGGSGAIAPGVGAVSSGVPVTVTPADDTTYTLTVTDAAGLSVSASTQVGVVYDAHWEFTDNSGWDIAHSAARIADGRLILESNDPLYLGSSVPVCAYPTARRFFGDAKLLAGAYPLLTITIESVQTSLFNPGVEPTSEVAVVYRNVAFTFRVPAPENQTLTFEVPASGPGRTLRNGIDLLRPTFPRALVRPEAPSISLQDYSCRRGLTTTGAVTVSAR